jgi:predicted nucleic acid-binding protein
VIPAEPEGGVVTLPRLPSQPGALSARDAVHVAVMKRRGLSRVMSFDAGYDRIEWIDRLG